MKKNILIILAVAFVLFLFVQCTRREEKIQVVSKYHIQKTLDMLEYKGFKVKEVEALDNSEGGHAKIIYY